MTLLNHPDNGRPILQIVKEDVLKHPAVINFVSKLTGDTPRMADTPQGEEISAASVKDRIAYNTAVLDFMSNVLQPNISGIDLGTFREQYNQLEKKYLAEVDKGTSFADKRASYLNYLTDLNLAFDNHVLPQIPKSFLPTIKRDKLLEKLIDHADMYQQLGKPRSSLVTVTALHNSHFLVQKETPLPAVNDHIAQEYLNTKGASKPLWYQKMPDSEKLFFDHVMKNVDSIEKVKALIPSLSSKLRSIPGVANFSKHESFVVNQDGELLKDASGHPKIDPPRLRSSIISSRKIMGLRLRKGERQKLMEEVAINNLHTIIETYVNDLLKDPGQYDRYVKHGNLDVASLSAIPILLQTLVSPKIGPKSKDPDYSLYLAKQAAIQHLRKNGMTITVIDQQNKPIQTTVHFKNLFSTNHPINPARHLSGTGKRHEMDTEENRKNIEAIIELGIRSGNDVAMNAANNLQSLLNMPVSGMDSKQREMHLAALEEIIVSHCGGLAWGACVSGKDRKATEVAYADSVAAYRHIYGNFPQPYATGKDRENFVNIFSNNFLSHHHQLVAGQNSPGANGIKTPGLYLPADMRDAIAEMSGRKKILKETTQLGDMNDYKKGFKAAKKLAKKSPRKASKAEQTSGLSRRKSSSRFKLSSSGKEQQTADRSPIDMVAPNEPLPPALRRTRINSIRQLTSNESLMRYQITNLTITPDKNDNHRISYEYQDDASPSAKADIVVAPNLISSTHHHQANYMMMIKTYQTMHPDTPMQIKASKSAQAGLQIALTELKIDRSHYTFVDPLEPTARPTF